MRASGSARVRRHSVLGDEQLDGTHAWAVSSAVTFSFSICSPLCEDTAPTRAQPLVPEDATPTSAGASEESLESDRPVEPISGGGTTGTKYPTAGSWTLDD